MKKMLSIIACCLLVLTILTGCEDFESSDSETIDDNIIVMPISSDEFYDRNYTIDEAIDFFRNLGFTNIKSNDFWPSSDPYSTKRNFKDNIFEVEVGYRDDDWDEGEEFDKRYTYLDILYNQGTLTPENSEDFLDVLTNPNVDRKVFMERYNGYFVEFDGYIDHKYLNYLADDMWYYVGLGDEETSETKGNEFRIMPNFIVSDELEDLHYDHGLLEGDKVHVIGHIDRNMDPGKQSDLIIYAHYIQKR